MGWTNSIPTQIDSFSGATFPYVFLPVPVGPHGPMVADKHMMLSKVTTHQAHGIGVDIMIEAMADGSPV